MVSTTKLVRGLKITGFLAVIFLCEVLVALGILIFFLGAINDQPDAGVLGFIIAAGACYVIRCLLRPLYKVIETYP